MELDPSLLVSVLGGTALLALLGLFSALWRKGRTEDEARAYLAGFTYVLSDDPDAAIAELSKAARLNNQTLETYFALGALFRRKGELDRAIRLHCNILLRSGLSPEIKRRAELALALDYKRSALMDKAADTFERLLAEDPTNREGLVHYRQVLEGIRDWPRAIELQKRLLRLEGKGESVLAHLLAELARTVLVDSPAEAEQLAERAAALSPSSADARLALGQVKLRLGKRTEAVEPLRSAVGLEPELAPSAVRLLAAALPNPGELEAFWQEQISARGEAAAPFELALALSYKDRGAVDLAIAQLRRLAERKPRLWEARKELGALLLAQDRNEELKAEYQGLLGTLGQPGMGFSCSACHQALPEHVFRCPSCESWDTVHREEMSSARPLI